MWSLALRFPHHNPVYASPLPHTRYMPAHLIFLAFITGKILGEEYRFISITYENSLRTFWVYCSIFQQSAANFVKYNPKRYE
jgi:hypothetical protein